MVLDIAAPQEVAFVARSCQQHFGTSAIHVLVNNAGNADPHMPQQAEAAAAHWRSMIDTNLTGGSVGRRAGGWAGWVGLAAKFINDQLQSS